ncbi:hypothetical protein L1281_001425 [Neisseria sp. HSC-16F19]|nr:hypothetical protein [Neisseria sp. HSC-16F19]MCP2040835.1 hypothetical protein [Neisseria sp. HSC-16F19]
MASTYPWAHIVHLLCAVIFVGGVFFEMLVLSVLHTRAVSREARREVEPALSRRLRRVMPWVILLLFGSGLMMLHRYAPLFAQPFTAFTWQLGVKIALALSILVHFITAVTKMRRNTLTAAGSRYIHTAVLIQATLIVLLAKTMFYLS